MQIELQTIQTLVRIKIIFIKCNWILIQIFLLGTLYIRRRNQLLRENAKFKDIETINQYLNIRMQLLQRKYGVSNDNVSSPASKSRIGSRVLYFHSNLFRSILICLLQISGIDPNTRNKTSRISEPSVSQNYAFSGVHHIFDQHTEPVSILKFANNDRSRLCCGSDDGSLSICDVTAKPPQVSFVLRGHSRGVTGRSFLCL
jgi:WD repeat-containing protein 13